MAYRKIQNIKVPISCSYRAGTMRWSKHEEAQELAQIALNAGNKDVSAFYVNAGHTFDG